MNPPQTACQFQLSPGTPLYQVAARSQASAVPGGRAENQDNFLVISPTGQASFLQDQALQELTLTAWPAGHARIAVLDGMGGHVHGREAAEAVVAALLTLPPSHSASELAARLDALHSELQHYFHSAGEGDGLQRPGTTLTVLELDAHGPALLYHVGDSRLYELGPDQITPLTVDHVPATALAMRGLLDEVQWWQHVHGEHRAQIAQAFILGNAIANPAVLSDPLFPLTPLNLPHFLCHLPDRRAVTLRPGASYLLATDGFWSCPDAMRWVSRWPDLLNTAPTALSKLAILFEEITRHPPAQLHLDNITAVLLTIEAPAHGTDLRPREPTV